MTSRAPDVDALGTTLANAMELWTTAGGYWFNPVKYLLALAWYFSVAWIAGWTARDARRCRAPNDIWNFAVTMGGLFGFLPILTVPFLPLGLFLALAGFLPLLFGYIHAGRNPHVRPADRLLTDEHLARVGRNLLAGIGWNRPQSLEDDGAVTVRLPRDLRRDPNAVNAARVLEETLRSAMLARASEIAFETTRDRASSRFRIDGVWVDDDVYEPGTGHSVIDLVVRLVAPKSNEPKKSLEGSISLRISGVNQTARTMITNAVVRRRLSLYLPVRGIPENIAQMGLSERDRPILLESIRGETGLVLVVGPPSAGLWTSAMAMLGDVDALTRRIAVVEEPGRPYHGSKVVDRFPVDPQHAAGVADAFKRAVASRPHVLVCGRLASAEVVNLAMESAKERLVIATVEAPGAINGLVRLLEAGAQRNELAQRLSAVIGQRLPRRLCTDCREAYLPSFEALRRANMIQFGVERLFRVPSAMAQRCQHCRGMGYHGCVPLFEMVMLTARFRALISSGASEREMNLEARKEGMESLSEQGLKLMAAGITSADEMRRILQESVS